MQRIVAREVVDELAAAAQEAHVLDAFDRAPDEGVTRGAVPPIRRHAARCSAHITMVACRLSSARATLSAASAEVLGLVRDGLPCS